MDRGSDYPSGLDQLTMPNHRALRGCGREDKTITKNSTAEGLHRVREVMVT